jgi:hypothetical protein
MMAFLFGPRPKRATLHGRYMGLPVACLSHRQGRAKEAKEVGV